jgi:hypothetical protein
MMFLYKILILIYLLVEEFNRGFYTYTDLNLEPNTFYSYKIEASNQHFTVSTNNVIAQTPPEKFIRSCTNKTQPISESSILLFGILIVDFEVVSGNLIQVSYDFEQWQRFIACLSDNIDLNDISIKILLQNSLDGLQALEFPYPNSNSSLKRVTSGISG